MEYNNAKICVDVFIDHWQQVLYFINNINDLNNLEIVFKHVDVMISIIIKECDEEKTSTLVDILDYCNENSIFQTIFYHIMQENLRGEFKEYGMINQLRLYDNLINFLPCKYLMCSNIILTILHLLEQCSLRSSVKIEHLSVHILYQLTVLITRDSQLFEFIKEISGRHFREPFYFIGLIIQLIHRDKDIGRLSQEAILLIFNFTKDEDSDLVDYICYRSDFSAILVTGLSGLYSSFPRKLENISDDWQQITTNFINSVPELKHSLEILDFCNLGLKMGHPKIKIDIINFLYTGFLSPVIGPSLHQNSLEETISSTAYLELYMRHLHQPLLIKLFLQFILTERKENYIVFDSLVNRLNSITMDTVEGMYTLGVVTLSLFRTMLSFHCEDFLFALVFRYLIPCDHLIKQKWVHLSHSSSDEDFNSFENQEKSYVKSPVILKSSNLINEDLSNSAEQFLKLSLGIYSEDTNLLLKNIRVDSITIEQRRRSQSPVVIRNLKKFSMYCPFYSYLHSAALYVNRRILASNSWNFPYDGINPSPTMLQELNHSFDQWNQKFQLYRNKEESNDTIVEPWASGVSDNITLDESSTAFRTFNYPIKDVGYYSSNNGSGSTISNKTPYVHAPKTKSSFSTNSESKVDLLCQTINSSKLYKLNFYAFEGHQMKESMDVDDEIENSKKKELIPLAVPLDDCHNELEEINLQNVLLSTDEGCNLSEFLVSLDLLEVNQQIDWNLNWNDVTLLVVQHGALENVEYGVSTLTSISPVESCEEHSQSPRSSTPTNEIIFKRRLQSFDQSMLSPPNLSSFPLTLENSITASVNYKRIKMNNTKDINDGPFLSAIFQRLSALPTNSFFMNLLITGIITDLAAYPHPLIKSLLLDIDIILQPHINKLYEILSEVKLVLLEKSSYIIDWESVLVSAYEYLYLRVDIDSEDNRDLITKYDGYDLKASDLPSRSINSYLLDFDKFFPSRKHSSIHSDRMNEKKTRKNFSLLKLRKKETTPLYRFPVQKFIYSKRKPITEYEAQQIRNLAYNWILFDEFCKELASLCQEHTQHCFF